MGLFQKKPTISTSAPSYTTRSGRTILVIGLGNPGKSYEGTRHNIGFAVVNDFARRNEFQPWIAKKDLKCELTINSLGGNRIILCRPATFMNDSGQSAAAVQSFYKISSSDTLAIYDELAIPLGQLRSRVGGSDAGHNGVKSLIGHIGEGFGRLRVGIGSELATKTEASNFVLSRFTKQEQEQLPAIIKEAGVMLSEYIFSGELPHDTRSVL